MDLEEFFNTVRDVLYFRVRNSVSQNDTCNVLKIKPKGEFYYLLAYVHEEDVAEDNFRIVCRTFEEYTDIVFENKDIGGIAIKVDGEYEYINHAYLRYLRMVDDRKTLMQTSGLEEFDKEEYIRRSYEKKYMEYLAEVKRLYVTKAYDKTVDFLKLIGFFYPEHNSEMLYYRGVVYEKVGNIGSAEVLYREAVLYEERNYWLHYKLAQFYRRWGKFDIEWDVYEQAYIHQRFHCKLEEKDKNDGIEYILAAMIEHEFMRNKRVQRMVYRGYAKEIEKIYKRLPEFQKYDFLDI